MMKIAITRNLGNATGYEDENGKIIVIRPDTTGLLPEAEKAVNRDYRARLAELGYRPETGDEFYKRLFFKDAR